MSRMKLWWRATMLGLGGIKLVDKGTRYTVEISLTLERDGRHVFVDIDPATARTMAASLKNAADRVDELNKTMKKNDEENV